MCRLFGYTKVGLLGLLAFVLLSCQAKPAKEARTLTPLTLAIGYIPNMQFAPLYVAMHEGYFAQAGIDLTIEYGMGSDILSILAGGRVHFALGDADQYLLARAQGMPLQASYQYYETSPLAMMSMDPTISLPSDLRGRRIGVSELSGSSYLTLMEFLTYYDISQEDVEIVRVGYAQLAALERGEVDAVVVFANNEPLQMREQDVRYQLWMASDFSALAGALILTNSNQWQSDEQQRVLNAFYEALTKAMRFTRDHPEEAAAIAQQYIDGAIYEDILAGIYATLAYYTESGVVDQARINATQESLRVLGFME
ncbi:ABC transporter substrate-binding protein [Entomospira culicis]|uniref:ABC transporter substrate-binding protein n=1 Tax=Entomospira culicis TaxID=2719989 RepID=A0A968GL33_9SPIO|nr:ABC transporter substrate-binding protein [Entomospira culicis]NIZ19305.1 ABC transporter substrate-binding protein [Entomospira culicis]NIZ69790.1 ABC transporter substrate-binding protein [Entomospira culicis]WDI36901.1 ABC transporter substrate-binding protein [Entomospira culicis]WDI38530.1 ABC transporter substrate-binding protein [Entomospira culicis]